MADAASDIAGQRVRQMRQRLGLTARDLAARCAQIGAPQITHTVITNLETGRPGPDGRRRRDITAGELLILAAALDVPPPYLLAPLDGDQMLAVTPALALDVMSAVAWLTGESMVTEPRAGEQAHAVFRRSRRPLNLLRHLFVTVHALTAMRERGGTSAGDYRVMLEEAARQLAELDGLGVATPPLPHWLADSLASLPRQTGT